MRSLTGLALLTILAAFALRSAQADSLVVTTCGTLPLAYAAGATRLETIDVNGNRCGTSAPPVSLPLPAGASTSALQTTGNTALTTINTTLGTPFQAGGSIGNTAFIATAPIGITPTDRTIASASGASQTLAAANAARHALTIQNIGNANCGVNPTGGTAAIGSAGTLTLVPNGAYTPRIPTLAAVTVICTAGQPIYGEEN
jgi:hypothetical protein